MTPEWMFELVEPSINRGEVDAIWVDRCDQRRCRMAGRYQIRDGVVAVAFPFRLSPGKAAEMGMPQNVPGRAWVDRLPGGTVTACDHEVHTEVG